MTDKEKFNAIRKRVDLELDQRRESERLRGVMPTIRRRVANELKAHHVREEQRFIAKDPTGELRLQRSIDGAKKYVFAAGVVLLDIYVVFDLFQKH